MISLDKMIRGKCQWKAQQWLGFFILIVWFNGCQKTGSFIQFNGETMGTTYSIKINQDSRTDKKGDFYKSKIDSVLDEIIRQMSTYNKNSEISQFNNHKSLIPFQVSVEFLHLIQLAQNISQLTEGAFDITVMPLVNIWGFGPESVHDNSLRVPPDSAVIREIMDQVGFRYLLIDSTSLLKTRKDITIDVNAIAKGFGVDKIAEFLEKLNVHNYLVEIGGEIRCKGVNNYSEPWKIGIEYPDVSGSNDEPFAALIPLTNKSVATSGDYRNYFIYNNEYYSHMIDPRTGYPIRSGIVSATVVAPTCAEADALATALMVLGEKEGIGLIETLDGYEALLILRDNSDLILSKSSGF